MRVQNNQKISGKKGQTLNYQQKQLLTQIKSKDNSEAYEVYL